MKHNTEQKFLIAIVISMFLVSVIALFDIKSNEYYKGYSDGLDDGFKYGKELQTEAILKYLKSGELQIEGFNVVPINDYRIWNETKYNTSHWYDAGSGIEVEQINIPMEYLNITSMEDYYKWWKNHSVDKTPEVYLLQEVNPCECGIIIEDDSIKEITINGTGLFVLCSNEKKKALFNIEPHKNYNVSEYGELQIGCDKWSESCLIEKIIIEN